MTIEHNARRKRVMKLIRQLLKQGYNQNSIAAMAKVPRQYICDFKKGRRNAGELFIFRLCYELGIDPGVLLYGTKKFRWGGQNAR